MEFSFGKPIKCFPSILHWNRFHSENPSNVFHPFYAGTVKFVNGTVTSPFGFVLEENLGSEIT